MTNLVSIVFEHEEGIIVDESFLCEKEVHGKRHLKKVVAKSNHHTEENIPVYNNLDAYHIRLNQHSKKNRYPKYQYFLRPKKEKVHTDK